MVNIVRHGRVKGYSYNTYVYSLLVFHAMTER